MRVTNLDERFARGHDTLTFTMAVKHDTIDRRPDDDGSGVGSWSRCRDSRSRPFQLGGCDTHGEGGGFGGVICKPDVGLAQVESLRRGRARFGQLARSRELVLHL